MPNRSPKHPETPIDDGLAGLRGDQLTADGRKLDDQPRVGTMSPDADPADPDGEQAPRAPQSRPAKR